MNGVGSTDPFLMILIFPVSSTTKIRPLLSPAPVTCTGCSKVVPPTGASEICGQVWACAVDATPSIVAMATRQTDRAALMDFINWILRKKEVTNEESECCWE